MMAFQIQQFLPEPGAILDFGCGHGWFLEACAAAGLSPLMGVDTSALAISELAKKGIQGMTINIGDATPSAILRDIRAQLSIQPQVITLLDVCEHFEGTRLMEWLRCMKDTFSHSLKLLILKVPSSNGLLFRGATNFSRLGIHGPLHQLYQVGTYPPHYHYFSDHSIRLLAKKLQFVSIAELGDPDLDPEGFSDRVRILKHLPRHVATFLGSILCSTARRMSATDTRILFLRPD
jgi:hypothetical protein